MTEKENELARETHDTVIEIKTVLLGTNGDNGLVGDVKRLGRSHYRLKQHFWILVGILVGSGILASGIYGILK
mgnify:CR=1 FL=1